LIKETVSALVRGNSVIDGDGFEELEGNENGDEWKDAVGCKVTSG